METRKFVEICARKGAARFRNAQLTTNVPTIDRIYQQPVKRLHIYAATLLIKTLDTPFFVSVSPLQTRNAARIVCLFPRISLYKQKCIKSASLTRYRPSPGFYHFLTSN